MDAVNEPERKCDNCINRGSWRAVYSKVQIGPQAFAVANCPHSWGGIAITPGSGTHCLKFQASLYARRKANPVPKLDALRLW